MSRAHSKVWGGLNPFLRSKKLKCQVLSNFSKFFEPQAVKQSNVLGVKVVGASVQRGSDHCAFAAA